MQKNPNIVTRFAPSPTGYLHIGGLRTALFNYLFARQNGGKFLLRIEDTDMARNSEDAARAIVESFKWVGLENDGEIFYQSKRFDIYAQFVQKLLDSDKAYKCYMSKDELEKERAKAQEQGKVWKYDNRYRDFKGVAPDGIKPVVRIKAPLEGQVCFKDGVKGEITISASELDDFIIARADGVPTYNFVVAIDDALMGVTHIIRGDDHLTNTSRQIVVYEALGFKIPEFFHVPMILNPQGKKLSKRDGAMGVMDYQKMGYLPETLINFLARLGFSYGDEEIFSLKDLLEKFSPFELNSAPSAYNAQKLLWLNQHYIKERSNDDLQNLISEFGAKKLSDFDFANHSKDAQDALFAELKDRSKTLVEFAENFNAVLNAPSQYDNKLLKKLDERGLGLLGEFVKFLRQKLDSQTHFQSALQVEDFTHEFIESQGEMMGQFMPILRLAILGKGGGIGLATAIFVLGVHEVAKRIENLKNFGSQNE